MMTKTTGESITICDFCGKKIGKRNKKYITLCAFYFNDDFAIYIGRKKVFHSSDNANLCDKKCLVSWLDKLENTEGVGYPSGHKTNNA